ncbi:MAG: rRNA maturation RNase YbeY [Mycobacteriales bacterium]
MTVEVANESGVQVDEAELAALAGHVLVAMGVNPMAELSVLLVDQSYMEQLHVRWMGEPGPTDVLAFPMDELDFARGPGTEASEAPVSLLGDVVLCPEVAQRQASVAGHSTQQELHLLCTHGVLHLLGYDHADPETEREMFAVQSRLLAGWPGVRS